MRQRARRWFGGCAIVLLFCVLICSLGFRYFVGGTIQTLDGRIVRDLSVAEVGDYAAPQYRRIRQAYLTNLEYYRGVKMTPAASSDASKVLSALANVWHDDGNGAAIAARQSRDVLRALADHWSLLLSRCAGMNCDDYRSRVGPGARLALPRNTGVLKYTLDSFMGGAALPAPSVDQSELAQLFCGVYVTADQFRSGSTRLVAWSLDTGGLLSAIAETSTETERLDVLTDKLQGRQVDLFVGALSQGQLIFYRSQDDWATFRQRHATVLRAAILLIVQTKGGDYYPLGFQSYYDPDSARWWLTTAARESSVRMASSPAFAF